jgi:hypothetical protein
MSEYPDLTPIYAASSMVIHQTRSTLYFVNRITFDYKDLGSLRSQGTFNRYYDFVNAEDHFAQEVALYWENLQSFLDLEINKVNGVAAPQKIIHCNIRFREDFQPSVHWVIEFTGPAQDGLNLYENITDPEPLDYPIAAFYYFTPPLHVVKITSSLAYEIHASGHILEFSGQKGDLTGEYDAISFVKNTE